MCARIWLKDGGFAKTEGREGEKRITQCAQQCTGSPYKHKKGEEERESARDKIELNSLILNYYLSIMGGMELRHCAGED